MKIYSTNLNKTAQAVVSELKNGGNFRTYVSKQAYDWLQMNANSLASLVEELLNDELGCENYVVITREKENGLCYMAVECNKVAN